jgi:hypothetical protein
MKTKAQQKGEMEDHNLPQDVANQTKSVDESRRHFTKSGLVVSGVLLTLASRPSLGAVCTSPSGFQSGNLSAPGTSQTCSGRSPGYFGTHSAQWPSPYEAGSYTDSDTRSSSGTMFKDSALGFHCSGYGSNYKNYSMMQIIGLGGGGDPHQLGAHIIAALLNARMGWTPVLTEAQVRNMFNEYDSKGYFEPTAGVKWYPEDIVTYLQSTMT